MFNGSLLFLTGVAVGILGMTFYYRQRERRHLHPILLNLQYLLSNLLSSAQQIQGVSKDVSDSSIEQLENLNSSASASEEIAAMTSNNSRHTDALLQDTESLSLFSKSGQSKVGKMVESSKKLNEGSATFKSEMDDIIRRLDSSFNMITEIAGKTKLINEIVFQTRLLSFNASVEAARAGESGKGFAVVAEEVGKLAEMSGTVSNEIAGIVEKSVRTTKDTIESTRTRIQAISQSIYSLSQKGLMESQDCEKIFYEINDKLVKTVPVVNGISQASKEQSQGVKNLNDSLGLLQELSSRNRLVASQSIQYGNEIAREIIEAQKNLQFAHTIIHLKPQQSELRYFEWTNDLVLGVAKMDDEHQTLVEKINHLILQLDGHHSISEVNSSFGALAQFVIYHFRNEEQYMESIHYPQLASHKKIHERLLTQVTEYKKDLDDNKIQKDKLVGFLKNWLISHIMGVDRQYANETPEKRRRAH